MFEFGKTDDSNVNESPPVCWFESRKVKILRSSGAPRIALYSHDTMGLGHIRRNILIAQALAQSVPSPEFLIISGAPEARSFSLPPRAHSLILPSLQKELNGQYRSRFLERSLEKLIRLRSETILKSLQEFCPDILIVDKVAAGVLGELQSALEYLKKKRQTRFVLGLRDVLDDTAIVKKEWDEARTSDIIREYYDAVWIYGDQHVFDTTREYDFPDDIVEKTFFTGYHDQTFRLQPGDLTARDTADQQQLVVCSVGGGQDGALLAESFAKAKFSNDTIPVILTGPFLPDHVHDRLQEDRRKNPQLRIVRYLDEPAPLIAMANRVVCMGGYNSICEVLSFEKPALIAPRKVPRREQSIRAEFFRKLGLIDVMNWDELTPDAITRWFEIPADPPEVRRKVDLNGLARIRKFASLLLMKQASLLQEGVR